MRKDDQMGYICIDDDMTPKDSAFFDRETLIYHLILVELLFYSNRQLIRTMI